MSFQHDEQEFDFSYMFEYNQDVQDEPKVGEFPSAKTYPLHYYTLCNAVLEHCSKQEII